MTLALITAAAAVLTGYFVVTMPASLLMGVLMFAVSFGFIGLVVFSGKGGLLPRFLCAASAAIAAITCAFTTGSLWTFVWVFLAADVVLMILAFLFLLIVCAVVDLEEPQAENDSVFYRTVMNLYIEALVPLARVKLNTRGLEKTPKEGRFLLVSNHLEIPDPVVLLRCFPKSQLAFISKKENMTMPIINKLMHKTLCQPIDREDDRQGLRVILKCIQLIKNDLVSVGVFPEGWTSLDGRIRHFRPGVFKIAQKANVPIVVCTLQNTQNIIPNLKKLKPTQVEMHLVGVIPAEELKGVTTADISSRVYEMMIADLGEEFRAIDTENT